MLQHTFHHLPGIGREIDQKLWTAGLTNWDEFKDPLPIRISQKRKNVLSHMLHESEIHLKNGDPRFFEQLLPAGEQWRLFPEFREKALFLLLGTTSPVNHATAVTTLVTYDGQSIRHFVDGRNLDDFKAHVQKYDLIITFNGKCFDVPVIESFFDLKLHHAHIDLRFILRSLGLNSGRRWCEKALGLNRRGLEAIDGHISALLWHEYVLNRNSKALEALLAVNVEKVLNMEALMVLAYNMKLNDTRFAKTNILPLPTKPRNPFEMDAILIEHLKLYCPAAKAKKM